VAKLILAHFNGQGFDNSKRWYIELVVALCKLWTRHEVTKDIEEAGLKADL